MDNEIKQIYPINVDASKLSYTNIQYNQNKKYCNLFYDKFPNKLYIQTPKLFHVKNIEKFQSKI